MPADPNPKVTLPGSGVLLHALNSTGDPVPLNCDDDGNLVLGGVVSTSSTGTPSRTPLAATIMLTGTAANLSTATGGTAVSQAAWVLVVPSGGANVLLGPSGNEVIFVGAGTERTIPSSTLDGWYAKSDGANVDVVLIGGQDV